MSSPGLTSPPAACNLLPPLPATSRPPPAKQARERVIELCLANQSLPDIKARLDAGSDAVPSQHMIGNILCEEGFGRLPRWTRVERALTTTLRLRRLPCRGQLAKRRFPVPPQNRPRNGPKPFRVKGIKWISHCTCVAM